MLFSIYYKIIYAIIVITSTIVKLIILLYSASFYTIYVLMQKILSDLSKLATSISLTNDDNNGDKTGEIIIANKTLATIIINAIYDAAYNFEKLTKESTETAMRIILYQINSDIAEMYVGILREQSEKKNRHDTHARCEKTNDSKN